MIVKQSLLDLMFIQMRCEYLHDLLFLNQSQRQYLTQKLKRLTGIEKILKDWNNALQNFTRSPPARTALEAQQALVNALKPQKKHFI